MKKIIITSIGLIILATSIFIYMQSDKIKTIEETSVSQTTNTTTYQTSEEKNIKFDKTPFCSEEEVKECENSKSSQCCPFELN